MNSKKHKQVLKHYLSDIVYGSTDGIVTTFVVITGVEGAQLSPTIAVILGIVNLFSDGLSMGASNFLSSRAAAVANNRKDGFKEPFSHAFTTFISFIILGAIPLISFIIPGFEAHRFRISLVATAIALLFVGILRAYVSKERWYQGMLEMISIGGMAALLAYFIGYYLSDKFV